MLVNNYEKGTIISFKLVTGDEIVAKLLEETSTDYVISKPMTVLPSQQGMALIQSLYTGDLDSSISLSKQQVIFQTKSVTEIKNYYIQTTTGIQPVNNTSIIT